MISAEQHRQSLRRRQDVTDLVERIRKKMRPWGITISAISMEMGVSRQYIWQVMYSTSYVSPEKAVEIDRAVDALIEQHRKDPNFGSRLRAARIGAGLTLKQVAAKIGYTWVAVERWEKNVCLPKPGVLWHLAHLYGVAEDWMTPLVPETQAVVDPSKLPSPLHAVHPRQATS